MVRWKQILKKASLGVVLITSWALLGTSAGAQYSSPNYKVNEVFLGTGGENSATSPNYSAKQSAGELGVGNTSSGSYQAQAGFNTTTDPFLEFTVTNSSTDLGVLNTGSTATTTGTFSVRAYLSSGYVVTTASDPPQNGAYTLNALSTPTASSTGSEQFGINLVRNLTSCSTPAPTNFGADPAQLPDGTFGFGAAATGYNTCGKFKYVKNDVIAQSTRSSGTTTYTISYIYNVGSTTPGGKYIFNHVLVATATY